MCHVLLRDPDLASGLDARRLERAEQECLATELVIGEGDWDPERAAANAARGGVGLLILEGLLVRRVGAEGRYGAELLGPGDLLRPWEHDGDEGTLPFETSFRVIERAHVAVLDLKATARLAAYPEVVGALVGRAMHRTRHLAVNMAIAHYPRVDQRLLLILWHLAYRWGRVTSEGVRIPLAADPHAAVGPRRLAASRGDHGPRDARAPGAGEPQGQHHHAPRRPAVGSARRKTR